MRVNIRPSKLSNRPVHEAGAATVFDPEQELTRMVSCCLLGENQFYLNGQDISERIFELASNQVSEKAVAKLALHARKDLGLRHVPLLLICALTNRRADPAVVYDTVVNCLRTPRDAMDLQALYWARTPHTTERKKAPLPYQFKKAFRKLFDTWSEFSLRRYATMTNVSVRERDVMMLSHPEPRAGREELFNQIVMNTTTPPDTWEVLLSRATTTEQKRDVWVKLLTAEHKMGALALVRNLRNMAEVGVPQDLVNQSLATAKAGDVWPWQALTAHREAPQFAAGLSTLVAASAGALPRLGGKTGVLVDVSSSMGARLSQHGSMTRIDAACGLAVVLSMMCDDYVMASFSNRLVVIDHTQHEGLLLANAIVRSQPNSGTYLGTAVSQFVPQFKFDRFIVLTDEQSHEPVRWPECRTYVVNLASYQRGLDTVGTFFRLHGWSGNIVRYIADVEGQTMLWTPEEEAA